MWQPRSYDKEKEKRFIELGQHKLISRLLAQRNIDPNSSKFLRCDYNELSHPYALNGIKEAAKLFCEVALRQDSVGCFGDYDLDGIVSVAIIKELSNVFNLKCEVILPDRNEQGYGLNSKSIQLIKERLATPPDLFFVLDSGTNSENEIQELKKWGIKYIIVIDHHLPDLSKISKSAVLVNWHLQENFDETCTCGELFHFIRGIRWLTKKINPVEFLSYAAMGVLADVSPIIGDNRIIVKHGLGEYALNHVVASGLIALLKKSGVYSKSISQEDVLFKIAPRINAAGRLGRPDIAFKLLVENDLATAELMASNLSELNDKRKVLQKKMEKEAIKTVKANPEKYEHGIVLYNPEWSIGVVGIVASKVVETFHKPTLIIGKNGNDLKGSGRSLDNVNLKEILDLCKEMLLIYGGHSMAGGVTLKPEYLDKANELFNQSCKKYYVNHGRPTECSYYDVVIPPIEVSIKNSVLLLDTLYPYCSQFNPEPVFLLRDVVITDVKVFEKDDWKSLNFVAERDGQITPLRLRMFSSDFGSEISGRKADIYISLPQNISDSKFLPQANILELILKK